MTEMKPVERVRTALEHQEPDRVPTALWGGPYGLVDELYFKMLDYLGLGSPVQPFRAGHNISYMDDRLLDKLGTDTRYVWPGDFAQQPHPSYRDAGPLPGWLWPALGVPRPLLLCQRSIVG